MGENILHSHENNPLSESFLKDNGKKFGNDCVIVLRLLYSGMRLTAKNVNDITGMADGGRRLRDIFRFKKECKRAIRHKPDGGKEGVEYWLDIPKQPTKSDLQKWFSEYQKEMPQPQAIQPNLF